MKPYELAALAYIALAQRDALADTLRELLQDGEKLIGRRFVNISTHCRSVLAQIEQPYPRWTLFEIIDPDVPCTEDTEDSVR